MSKQSVLWALLDLVFLAVFNVVFFVAGGTNHPASVWLAYAFIHFSYLMVIVTPLLIRGGSAAAVFGFSLYSLAGYYFIAELIVGTVFIFLAQEDLRLSLVVQVIIAGVYLVLLFSHMLANEKTAESQMRKEAEVTLLKAASSKLQGLLNASDDKETARLIRKLYDTVKASPTRTSAVASQYEYALMDSIEAMEQAATSGDDASLKNSANGAMDAIVKRNRALRTAQ